MDDNKGKFDISGPLSCANWKALVRHAELKTIVEYPLYTDARILGDITEGYGPYKFLNTVPGEDRPGLLTPSIMLRAEIYLDNDHPKMDVTDTSSYHGGWFSDEIAALVSLFMGVRVRAADVSRRFDKDGDPLGRPQAFRLRNAPSMSPLSSRLKIPSCVGEHSLESLYPMKLLPSLSKDKAIAVIRAAKLYQDALWIAESEPALSWILFVSALETGANMWHNGKDTPVSKLAASKPDLYKMLEDAGIDGLSERVANAIIPSLGATSKFTKFVLEFLPDPPEIRPAEWAQISWTRSQMRTALGKIYGYRSNALHGGIPFPAPMCLGGMVYGDFIAEKPTGLAASSLGGVWLAEDTPMLLHVFEYITRRVLTKWIMTLGNT